MKLSEATDPEGQGVVRGHLSLSQAARKGAEMHPQGFGELVEEKEGENGPYLCTCFLGAAWAGLGKDIHYMYDEEDKWVYEELRRAWPELERHHKGPVHLHGPLQAIITRLNDLKRWTREDIADWLESEGL